VHAKDEECVALREQMQEIFSEKEAAEAARDGVSKRARFSLCVSVCVCVCVCVFLGLFLSTHQYVHHRSCAQQSCSRR
jgi:hypothetical protein